MATSERGILKSGADTALRNADKLMISTPRTGPQSLSSNCLYCSSLQRYQTQMKTVLVVHGGRKD